MELLDVTDAAAEAAGDQPGLRGGHRSRPRPTSTAGDVQTIVVPEPADGPQRHARQPRLRPHHAVYDKTDALVQVHPAAKDITLDIATKTDPVPIHPGSERALQELGQ